MTSGFLQRGLYIAAFLVAVLAVSLGVSRYSYGQALDQLSRQGQADLTLASDRLTAQLQRFRELAVYLADHPVMGPLSRGAQPVEAQQLFLDVADKTAALDVMFVNLAGQVRVAARSEPGADLSRESFVRRAMHGALGWGQGTRTPLPARAFYYAAPSFDRNGQVQGAVVVAADISDIENNWRSGTPAVFFTDDSGEVFVSNRTELVAWRRPDNAPGLVPPNGVPLEFSSYMTGPHEVWQLEWGPYLPKSALHLTQPVPVVGLTGEALLNVAPAARLATSQALAVAGLCLAFGALLFLTTERRRTLAIANAQLEARVANRTQALTESNSQLRREASEREQAQAALAQAQADLVQAGKLSALGQMSAGISHELNQPLMAIQTFADNSVHFMELGQTDRVTGNLTRISDMTRRMGRIIKNLRAFSRQETEPQATVDVVGVLESALELTAPKRQEADVTLDYHPPSDPVWVRGGEVRLGQVFVNLISNAADAMSGSQIRVLRIDIREKDRLSIQFSDTGPGIETPDKVFDPFYTTKNIGSAEGMGLGLSISYGIVQSFGGEIKGENTDTGAQFTVWLDQIQGTSVA